jgi:hypothetical protein
MGGAAADAGRESALKCVTCPPLPQLCLDSISKPILRDRCAVLDCKGVGFKEVGLHSFIDRRASHWLRCCRSGPRSRDGFRAQGVQVPASALSRTVPFCSDRWLRFC